ncbi:MAG: hypothetical protein IVW55_13005 [Chloroflexi bacterium]|nr:hypothetical protein [Chloroflexota bacterium]
MTAHLDLARSQHAVEPEVGAEVDSDNSFERRDMLWLAAATLVVTVVTFLFGIWGSGGHLAPPLDDTFIHFQYARQLANGHPFQYNTGDALSSGDSSFLFPFLLAPAFAFLDGLKPLLYADLLNFVAHLAAVLLLYKLALQVAGRPVALFSAGFLLLDGRLNWTFLTGMETGAYTAALVAFFWAWLHGMRLGRFGWLAATGVLTALLRPEGHILISVVCLATIGWLWRSRRLSMRHMLLLAPVVVGLLPYAVNLAATGYWQFNTAASKSIWYIPYMPLQEKLSLSTGYFMLIMKDVYLGMEVGRSPFPLLGIVLAALGVGVALAKTRYRFLHSLIIFTFTGGVGLALLLPPTHFYRYYHPYDWIVWLYISTGVAALVNFALPIVYAQRERPLAQELKLKVRKRALVVAAIALAIPSLPQFIGFIFAFGDSTRDIYYQQMAFSQWLTSNIPPDASIAVNDVGAHKYLTKRYTVDVVGLTTNSLRGAAFSGWGTIYDAISRLPGKERPDYLLIHPDIAVNNVNESVSQQFLTPLYSVTVRNPIITAGPTEELYKINWDYALADPSPTYLLHVGEKPLDTLNVGDLIDEGQHSYKIAAEQPSLSEPKSIVTTSSYGKKQLALTESGRIHTGWEEFTVKSVQGKSLALVSRARLSSNASQSLAVSVNGKQVGAWTTQNVGDASWQEYEYIIPAQFITGDLTTLRLTTGFDPGGATSTSYRYWVYAR